MKNKLFISALMIASCSVNAGVMLEDGVELLSRNQEITGPGTGYFKDTTGSFFFNAFVTAQTYMVNGRARQNTMLTSDHAINLHNASSHTERYTVTYKMCSNSSCNTQISTYSIQPSKSRTETGTLYLNISYPGAGIYEIVATTSVIGDSNASDQGTAQAIISR